MKSRALVAAASILPILLIIGSGLVGILTPALVTGWKMRGLREFPIFWQIAIDLSDFTRARWFVWLPLYILFCVLMSRRVKNR